MKYLKYFTLALLIIGIDQTVKLVVHFNMEMGSTGQIPVFGDWFKIYYILNPGMAFGMKLNHEYGKLILTIIRLFAMIGISWYIIYLVKRKVQQGLIWCVSLILAGAVGNVIDSIFYGIWLDNAPYNAPYKLFHGQVVDMFYVDIWEGFVADWVPVWGGQHIALWPIFNVADASIFIGVCIILIFQHKFFPKEEPKTKVSETSSSSNEADLTSGTK